VFGVESGLSNVIFHLDSGLLMQVWGRGGVEGVKAKSSQVSDMFPESSQ